MCPNISSLSRVNLIFYELDGTKENLKENMFIYLTFFFSVRFSLPFLSQCNSPGSKTSAAPWTFFKSSTVPRLVCKSSQSGCFSQYCCRKAIKSNRQSAHRHVRWTCSGSWPPAPSGGSILEHVNWSVIYGPEWRIPASTAEGSTWSSPQTV